MKRIVLAVVLVALSWSCFGQDARCAAANQAIANAEPGTAMAPLYDARDACNQRIANMVKVHPSRPKSGPEEIRDSINSLINQDWKKIADTPEGSYSFGPPHYDSVGAEMAIRTVTELADGTRRMHFDVGFFPCMKGSGMPRSFIHQQSLDMIVESSGRAFPAPYSNTAFEAPYPIDVVKGSPLEYAATAACM